ncbi:hypothetical protein MN608_00821 [Microdochium nivale]|nr:hypothetical protein MN608_00821 [Microdochium nivale]
MATTTHHQHGDPPAPATAAGQDEDPLFDPNIPWHVGEQEMQRLLLPRVLYDNPTSEGMPAGRYGRRMAASPLVALGTLDGLGRPWASLAGGEVGGLLMPIAQDVLAIRATVDVSGGDPVVWGS